MNDLISKKAAIETVNRMADRIDTGDIIDYRDVLVEYFKVLPSVQQNRLERAVAGNSPEEIYDFLYWLMFDYARAFTDSRAAVIAWLKEEDNE